MQRRHSTTGYSPNELVFATEVWLPPPVGELHWAVRTAAVSPDVLVPSGPITQTPGNYLEDCSQRAQELCIAVHDRILQAQRQTSHRSALGRGVRKLAVGVLAYLLTKTDGFKTTVNSPFVVSELSEWHAELTLWHHPHSLTCAVSQLHTADPLFWVFLGCVVWEWEASSRSMERCDVTGRMEDEQAP